MLVSIAFPLCLPYLGVFPFTLHMPVDFTRVYSLRPRRFLGLRPRPRWGSLRRSLRPPSREGLLAFGNRSFAPSALSPFLAPQTKIPVLLAPKHKILEPPLVVDMLFMT